MARGGTSVLNLAFNSANSSTYTSSWYNVADAATLSVSWNTAVAVSSILTIQGSNNDGLQSAINDISTVTAIATPGIYTIDPGIRWIRFQRFSNESTATTLLAVYMT